MSTYKGRTKKWLTHIILDVMFCKFADHLQIPHTAERLEKSRDQHQVSLPAWNAEEGLVFGVSSGSSIATVQMSPFRSLLSRGRWFAQTFERSDDALDETCIKNSVSL